MAKRAKKSKWPALSKGQAIAVYWHDIVGSVTGDPNESKTAFSVTLGFFHSWVRLNGKKCLRTHLTRYPGTKDDPMGYDTYPEVNIERIDVLPFTERSFEEVQALRGEAIPPGSLRAVPDATV